MRSRARYLPAPMSRVVNFNAGPATLPLSALEHTRDELLDFEGTGMSILEHSHRGGAYMRVHEECKVLLRELLAIPDTHEVIFMGGGGTKKGNQTVPSELIDFAAIAINLGFHELQNMVHCFDPRFGTKLL